MISFLILLLVLTLLPDLYIWQGFAKDCRLVWRILYWVPTAAILLLPLVAQSGRWQNELFRTAIFLFLLVVIPKLLFVLCSLLGRLLALWFPVSLTVGNTLGFALALTVMAGMGYGLVCGWKRLVINRQDIVCDRLPEAFDGYTIVQLSDFHIGTYQASPEMVERIVDSVNALRPDLICFTGDLVNLSPDEVPPFIPVLARLKARDGVFSVLGNHDYCLYRHYTAPDSPARSLAAIVGYERDMGWTLLRNEHRILHRGTDSLAVAGVENAGAPPFPSLADMPRTTAGLDTGIFTILLSHDPTHWRREVLPQTDIPLMLSGHTHAMQLKVGGFSPSRWIYREWGGLYHEGTRQLHVSTGVGSNVPFRLGAWPEIVVLTLRRK